MNKARVALVVRSCDTDEISSVSLFDGVNQAIKAVERDYGVKPTRLEVGTYLIPAQGEDFEEPSETEVDQMCEYPRGSLILDLIATTDETKDERKAAFLAFVDNNRYGGNVSAPCDAKIVYDADGDMTGIRFTGVEMGALEFDV